MPSADYPKFDSWWYSALVFQDSVPENLHYIIPAILRRNAERVEWSQRTRQASAPPRSDRLKMCGVRRHSLTRDAGVFLSGFRRFAWEIAWATEKYVKITVF